jgi:transglutaminase-like putative cysteine protease
VPVEKLPPASLPYLCASRYCETDRLGALAWKLFGEVPPGRQRVKAISDYVHERLTFSYGYAQAMRTALEAHEDRLGVSRDYAHLAIALCRCMNMPARYVNGYMADIDVAASPAPMDFNAWFEVFLGGRPHPGGARPRRRRYPADPDVRQASADRIHRLDVGRGSALSRPHRAADVSLLTPWFSEAWPRHLQQRERERH